MRKVFSSASETIHVFAQRSQEEGRCSNVFFEGDKVYSYGTHYLLAEFIDNGEAIIINEGYSSTTSKHISYVTSATSHYKQYFKSDIDVNLVYLRINKNFNLLPTARKKEKYINEIVKSYNNLKAWDKFDKKSQQWKEIKSMYRKVSSVNLDDFLAAEKKKKQKAQDVKLQKFFNFEVNRVNGSVDYLRINGDFVETTQQIRIPREDAKALYKAIVAGVDVTGRKINYYTINKVDKSYLTAGCHKISMKNIKEIGKQL